MSTLWSKFRLSVLADVAASFAQQSAPLDVFLSHYFRSHKAVGSKDRALIATAFYDIVRWKRLIDCTQDIPEDKMDAVAWQKRARLWIESEHDIRAAANNSQYSHAVRSSFPDFLFDKLRESYGLQGAVDLCAASNSRAPTFGRVNTSKMTVPEFMQQWNNAHEDCPVVRCKSSPVGVRFMKRVNLLGTDEHREGLFEIQDEGSQMIGSLVEAKPGSQVLDYCAGSGGKSLLIAATMQGKGQLYLHDVRDQALVRAKQRFARAGIQNAQFLTAEHSQLKKLQHRMDWVLVDAPCSGTGTLRRSPDAKWKLTKESVEGMVKLQREIVETSLRFLKPETGRLVYATCSILPEENERQVEYFRQIGLVEVTGKQFRSVPRPNEMDGFFATVLQASGSQKGT